MSVLEGQTRSILVPLIRGKPTEISLEQQLIIVRWLVKTSMMHEFLAKGPYHFEPEERRAFMESFTLPAEMLVFLAAYGGTGHVLTRELLLPLLITRSDTRQASAVNAYSATFAFSHLALQIFTYRRPDELKAATVQLFLPNPSSNVSWQETAIQIWPNSSPVRWPPPLAFGNPGFEMFANRWTAITEKP